MVVLREEVETGKEIENAIVKKKEIVKEIVKEKRKEKEKKKEKENEKKKENEKEKEKRIEKRRETAQEKRSKDQDLEAETEIEKETKKERDQEQGLQIVEEKIEGLPQNSSHLHHKAPKRSQLVVDKPNKPINQFASSFETSSKVEKNENQKI